MLPNYTLRIIFKVRIESAKRLMRSLGLNIDREPLVLLDECCWLNAGVEECIPSYSLEPHRLVEEMPTNSKKYFLASLLRELISN